MIRSVKVAPDTAVKAQTQVLVTLKATLVTAREDLRARLEPLSTPQLVAECAPLEVGKLNPPAAAMRDPLAAMANRWLQFHQEMEAHTQHLSILTHQAAPGLVQAYAIGPDTAAERLITLGDNSTRVHCEAAFAKLCGVCPLPVSSGKTQRHRLNRGGNCRAHAALFRVSLSACAGMSQRRLM
jgi:transposase